MPVIRDEKRAGDVFESLRAGVPIDRIILDYKTQIRGNRQPLPSPLEDYEWRVLKIHRLTFDCALAEEHF